MKKLITLIAFTMSVGAFAQETRVLDGSTDFTVSSARATLIRTAQSEDKFEVTFTNIPMTRSEAQYETVTRPGTCYRTVYHTQTRTTCTNGPRSPQNPSGRTCHTGQVTTSSQVPYSCMVTSSVYRGQLTIPYTASDKVKIKFKGLPKLGGSETETFEVVAFQKDQATSNVVYTITPTSTINGAAYAVEKKGILGYDSYVIEPK